MIRANLRANLRDNLRDNLRANLRANLRNNLLNNLRDNLRANLRVHLREIYLADKHPETIRNNSVHETKSVIITSASLVFVMSLSLIN